MNFSLCSRCSHELFLFSRWDSGYHEAFFMNFLFFKMGSWLSRSLFHELFFHDGILAITKPFSRTFYFLRWDPGYHEAFFTNFFFFHDGILAIRDLGEDSFYTYVTKSIYIGSASLKTLPLDLEPPLQGKEYGPSLF
jgi:hypothetical protein